MHTESDQYTLDPSSHSIAPRSGSIFSVASAARGIEDREPFFLTKVVREDDGSQSGARPDENNGCVFRDKISDLDSLRLGQELLVLRELLFEFMGIA